MSSSHAADDGDFWFDDGQFAEEKQFARAFFFSEHHLLHLKTTPGFFPHSQMVLLLTAHAVVGVQYLFYLVCI